MDFRDGQNLRGAPLRMTVFEGIDVEEAASMQPGQCSFRASAFSQKPRAKSQGPITAITAITRDYGDHGDSSKPPAN